MIFLGFPPFFFSVGSNVNYVNYLSRLTEKINYRNQPARVPFPNKSVGITTSQEWYKDNRLTANN